MPRFTGALCFSLALAALARPSTADDRAELRRAFDYDARKPVDTRLTLLRDEGGVKTYDLTYPSPRDGGMVTGFLIEPPDAKGPFAGIVFGHWARGTAPSSCPRRRCTRRRAPCRCSSTIRGCARSPGAATRAAG